MISIKEADYMLENIRASNHQIVIDSAPHCLENFLQIKVEFNNIESVVDILKRVAAET